MDKANRLGIFCFYDKEGIVGEYVEDYLKSIQPYLQDMVVVCNGKLSAEGEAVFQKYTDKVYVRKNIGLDGGAYQDVIINILGFDYIRRYQELLLFNDTVYAPIGSWLPVFRKMQESEADFWGLTQNCSQCVPRHIQSYFVLFRDRLLHSIIFEQFWRELIISNNLDRTVADFEINMSYFFEKNGFSFETYCECTDKNIYVSPFHFLKEEKLPVLKTKIFFPQNDFFISFEERENIKSYITTQTDYDFYHIELNMRRKAEMGFFDVSREKYSWKDMIAYASHFKECYIYGNTLKSYILRNILPPEQIKAILVSDGYEEDLEKQGQVKICRFSEVENDGEGLIVTLGYKNSKALKSKILEKFPDAIFYWEI